MRGGVYCRRSISFFGIAQDNQKVESVKIEIKSEQDNDYKFFQNAEIDGENFTADVTLPAEGVFHLKFTAVDKRQNYSTKSSKVLTLLADETAPVAAVWYIDRKFNGIQYYLKTLEELKSTDYNLSENKDAAQNVKFAIRSSFKDTMGIEKGSVSIKLRDESGNFVCEIQNSANSDYSPVFEITEDFLAGINQKYKTGIHYFQILYNAKDIVTIPGANETANQEIEGGWFLWYPESDNPKITQKPESDAVLNQTNINVKNPITLTVFDDDALSEIYAALLTDSEYEQIKNEWKQNLQRITDVVPAADKEARTKIWTAAAQERDATIALTTLESPQTMHLLTYAKDIYGKNTYKDEIVNVVDSSAANVYISEPQNNSVPNVTMSDNNTKANIIIKGQTLDTFGCNFTELVWVPNFVASDKTEKRRLAEEFLASLDDSQKHQNYAPSSNQNERKTVLPNGLVLWSIKPGAEIPGGNGYKKQEFSLEIDLLNEFASGDKNRNEKNENKWFLFKITRKDGKSTYQEYKLSADNTKPIIRTNLTQTTIIESKNDYILKFDAYKENGLKIDESGYKIIRIDENQENPGNTFKIEKTDLENMQRLNKRPIYEFVARDIFGNETRNQYTLIISNLPQLKSLTTTSASQNKVGDTITIEANFSDTVNVNTSDTNHLPYIPLKGFNNGEKRAEYSGGTESATISFSYTVKEGDSADKIIIETSQPIIENDNSLFKSGETVHLTTLDNENNLKGKTISVDGISPKIQNVAFSSDATGENKNGNLTYLKEGRTLTATVTFSEQVIGSAKLKLQNNVELNFDIVSDNKITFSKKIESTDTNGELYYSLDKIFDFDNNLTDLAGNSLFKETDTTQKSTNFVIDTGVPVAGNIKIKDFAGNSLSGGYKKAAVDFTIEVEKEKDIKKIEYSLDNGINWNEYKTAVLAQNSAQVTARVTDYAGNISDSTPAIELEIERFFPKFEIECTNPGGYYKKGDKINFKINFDREVEITNDNAYIILHKDKKEMGKATLTPNQPKKTNSAEFVYEVQVGNNFDINVAKDGIHLNGINDLFGFSGEGAETEEDYSRKDVHCDGTLPTVTKMEPGGYSNSYEDKGIYTNGKTITLTFSEPVQKGTGNITLRQTEGWAIPPVLTAKDFNTICEKLTDDEKNTLARRNDYGTLEEDKEETGTYDKAHYHGTGQFIGPYKKSMQGITEDNIPDTNVKYVLDFDIDIWETDTVHYIGKTFNENHEYVKPTKTITANDIRNVLEKAGYHKRVLDVTSSFVKITGTEVEITFPAGLTGDKELPNGREWELVIDEGAFLDMAGNGIEGDVEDNRADNENKQIYQCKPTFYSDKVATPVIRVDRYSYGFGIFQPNENGDLQQIVNVNNNVTQPTGRVRVRIDCETKDAEIKYGIAQGTNTIEKDATEFESYKSYTSTEGGFTASSYWTKTTVNEPSGSNNYEKIFTCGSGKYYESSKEIIVAQANKDGFTISDEGSEGVFQTVLYLKKPCSQNGSSYKDDDDISIRGTTGWGGEPYITPFPLRDAKPGTPYMRRAYKEYKEGTESTDFYWVSFEILVPSSVSNYNKTYNYAAHWSWLEPGEFTRCDNMRNWGW